MRTTTIPRPEESPVRDRRDEERRLVAGAVEEVARRTGFPVAFGGLLHDGDVTMTAFHGDRTGALHGLAVRPERGLGGRSLVELRPRLASDYGSARQITHDYDAFILGEGIGTLLAVPVVVGGRARGVLYGGTWGQGGVGGVAAAPAVRVADELAAELRVRDEVERRLGARRPDPSPPMDARQREELRESYAELRRIAAGIPDATTRARIEEVERRLAALSGGPSADRCSHAEDVRLSRREVDVLAQAALGATNAEIAARLELREGTVKAYLGSAMSKLSASTRMSAVAKARRLSLLP